MQQLKETKETINKALDKMQENDTLDSKLDLYKFLADVKGKVKTEVTSDLILAKLEDKDKLSIIEMTSNAYYGKKLIEQLKHRKEWKWNKTSKNWERQEPTKEEKEIIQNIADALFNMYMIRIHMTTLVNRNKTDNYILELISNYHKEPNKEDEEEEGILTKLTKKLKRDKKEKANED